MPRNLPGDERLLRVLAGGILVFVVARWFDSGWPHRITLAAAVGMIGTAVVGWSPVNAVVHGATDRDRREQRRDTSPEPG